MLSERKEKRDVYSGFIRKIQMNYTCIDLGYNWYFMSRFWEGASAGLVHRYFKVPRTWFIIGDGNFELILRNGWPTEGIRP